MDDLKSVTVSYLRELARKHLGPGHSKLNKEELIAALAAYVPALAKLARLAGIIVPPRRAAAKKAEGARKPAAKKSAAKTASSKRVPEAKPAPKAEPEKKAPAAKKAAVAKAPERPSEQTGRGSVSAPKRVAAKRASEKPGATPPARPAHVVTFPPKPRAPKEPGAPEAPPAQASVPPVSEPPVAPPPAAPPPPPVPAHQHAAEPLVEGFFVARVAGEEEARRHHLLEEQARRLPPADRSAEYNEHLGELPLDYQDDTALLMPRDPHTLFVFWDFSATTRNRALDGLDSPRAVLKVFDGERLVRELDFAIESRSFYIHGLPPGRPYRVEAHFVGRDGRTRRIGHSTNRVTLPPTGPSTDTSVRYLRMPTRVPEPQNMVEAAATAPTRTPEFEEREYVSWRRVNLPGSAGVQDIPERRRERSGPGAPPPPGSHLMAPPRPEGASDQRYLHGVGRAPGASDQRYLDDEGRQFAERPYLDLPRAPGASDQRYLAGQGPQGQRYLDVGRAPGASDQRYLDVGRAPGASDQRYLDLGRVPGASDMRYLDVGRAPGASDMRYLDVSRAPGASDMRYLDVPRAPGASDQRYVDAAGGRPPGASEQTPPRTPPSGRGRS